MVQVTGERVRQFMRRKIEYTDEPMNPGKIVKDFLPKPEELTFRKEGVMTLRLAKATVSKIKEIADTKGLGMSTLVRMWVMEKVEDASTIKASSAAKALRASGRNALPATGSGKFGDQVAGMPKASSTGKAKKAAVTKATTKDPARSNRRPK
jgi:predicted DNA binding CopG/RHH family protein